MTEPLPSRRGRLALALLFLLLPALAAAAQRRAPWTAAIVKTIPRRVPGAAAGPADRLRDALRAPGHRRELISPLAASLVLAGITPRSLTPEALNLAIADRVRSDNARAAEIIREAGAQGLSDRRLVDNARDAETLIHFSHPYLTQENRLGLIAAGDALRKDAAPARERLDRKALEAARRAAQALRERAEDRADVAMVEALVAVVGPEMALTTRDHLDRRYALAGTPAHLRRTIADDILDLFRKDTSVLGLERVELYEEAKTIHGLILASFHLKKTYQPALAHEIRERTRKLLEDYISLIADNEGLDEYTRNDHAHKARELIAQLPDLF